MSEKRSYIGSVVVIGGGAILTGLGVGLALRKSSQTVKTIETQVQAPPIALPPSPVEVAKLPTFKARLTGYWPFKAGLSEAERKMEGGKNDRMGRPLMALEQHLQDPAKYPYVSVAGDDAVFPYGQRLTIDAWPNAVFRVVDTGGNFRGVNKVYRIAGYEPLDICQLTSDVKKPTTATVKIIPGDTFTHTVKKGTVLDVVTEKIKNQQVVLSGLVEGRTVEDYEALARAIESELGRRPLGEQHAGAWAMRNRADRLGIPVAQLLAPLGLFGGPRRSGGYVSTRKVAREGARRVAEEVLGATADEDPTSGAIDYWVPADQDGMHALAKVHEQAVVAGDVESATKYAHYAGYGTEGDVRKQHARDGLKVVSICGGMELLGWL